MQLQKDSSENAVSDLQYLANALASIPIPKQLKVRTISGAGENQDKKVEITYLIKDITFKELVERMRCDDEDEANSVAELKIALVILNLFGVISLEGIVPGIGSTWGGIRVRATSEQAGYLIRSLSEIIATEPYKKSSISPDAKVDYFYPVLETALEQNRLNPHQLLSILFEQSRKNAAKKPIRTSRVISVLIKGERINSDKTTEQVYLHVKKPDWDSYSLIGSTQMDNEDDETTARIALDEDFISPSSVFELIPSGVDDVQIVDLSITAGAYTRYSFNLLIVGAINGEFKFRDDLKYGWFSYKEICNQISKDGHPIITRAELLKKIDEKIGLNTIPVIVRNSKSFLYKSIKAQFREILKEMGVISREFGNLALLIWRRIIVKKWWILLFLGLLIAMIFLRPYLNRSYPTLSTVADVLGIIGFIISLWGIISNVPRHRSSDS